MDDDEVVLAWIRGRLLQRPGTHVCCATTVDGARRLSAFFEFDLVITDYNLPDGSAVDVCRENRFRPIVIITGHPDGDLMARAMDPLAVTHLLKPFNHLQLWDAINRVMRKMHAQDEHIQAWLERRRHARR